MSADRVFHLAVAWARPAIIAALALLLWTTPPDTSADAASGRAQRLAPPLERRLATSDDLPCPPGVPNVPAPNYKGQSLVNANFNRRSLVNADFSGATLDGVVFIGADLRGANFSGATFLGSKAGFPNDFTLANLTSACFFNARFLATVAPTYFSHANFTGVDFSSTDLSGGNALLGPAPLAFDAQAARPRFRNSMMNCEFVAQWAALDLAGARGLHACASQLKGANLSGAQLANVDLSKVDLSKTRWAGADLTAVNLQGSLLDGATGLDGGSKTNLSRAKLNGASARYVDFSGGKLGGANFTGADLEGADFGAAQLTDPTLGAAKFDGAHLKDASFVGTTLTNVSFTYASLYGSALGAPSGNCPLASAGCGGSVPTGATCGCATMRGADLTGANFTNAFLYGVDFSTQATKVNGTLFTSAILVAANFRDASFSVDSSQGGQAPTFNRAWLQGAQMPGADLNNASASGAFVDFGAVQNGIPRTSNRMLLLLSRDYTQFANWSGSATPCVKVEYTKPSALPPDIGTMTCPNGQSFPVVGCGPLRQLDPNATVNPKWFGGRVEDSQPVAGVYLKDSTYEQAKPESQACNGQPADAAWYTPNPPQ